MASRAFWRDKRAVAAAIVVGASPFVLSANNSKNNDNEEVKENKTGTTFERTISSLNDQITITKPNYSLLDANVSTTSIEKPHMPSTSSPSKTKMTDHPPSKTLHYDFVILGNGNAGREALETLRKQCPSATIALVDPLQSMPTTTKSVDFFPQAAVRFQPYTKTVQLSRGDDSGQVQLHYRHAILVATGSRAAPPPLSLIDEGALDRILELRPTECLDRYKEENNRLHRPVLPARTVREITRMASSEGNTVGILGSGWEAIELAAFAAHHAGKKNKPVLTFGSAGPLSHILPRYLSTAVTRRLRQCGVQVQERSLVRYVADLNYISAKPQLELHTAKSYDLMATQRTMVDCLVVAPYIDGTRGTALLPTMNAPQEMKDFTNNHVTWYSTWSQLTCPSTIDPSMVVCYADDGRIAVNAELSAASNVYAAGSVAKYPNSNTGHAHVAGEGSVDGAMAGHLAALRMSQEYKERTNRTNLRWGSNLDNNDNPLLFASSSFPVWRSDMCSYLPPQDAESSSLSSIGVRAICIGKCDSEGMATHGYWWTNVSIKKRYTKLEADKPLSTTKGKRDGDRRNRNSTASNKSRPVYGAGVVYYLDRIGKISGIMVWGLPFTTMSEDGEQKVLNERLLSRMKDIIRSDGNVTVSDFSSQIIGHDDLEDGLLLSDHLAEESRHLATIALENQSTPSAAASPETAAAINEKSRRILGQIQVKPLYRYTAAKPPSITSIGMLKRKDQTGGGELIGENIYVQNDECENMMDASEQRPQSLVYVYPMDNFTSTSLVDSFLHDGLHDRLVRSLEENETRSRPPKEEPLWLRRGEEAKMTNRKQIYANLIESNMKRGQFSDGTDAVKQAPVPQIIQKFKTKVKGLMGKNTEEDNSMIDDDITNDGGDITTTAVEMNIEDDGDTSSGTKKE